MQVKGQKHHAAIEGKSEKEHDADPGAIGALFKEAQVYHRVFGFQLPIDQKGQGHHRDQGQADDKGRLKPVFPLAFIQDYLEGGQAHHQKPQPYVVDAPGPLGPDIIGVEDVGPGHCQGEEADGQIYIKNPAPVPIIGDPPPQDGADNGGDHHPDAPDGHGHAPFPGWKSLQQNGLGQGLQGAASHPLKNPEKNQGPQVGSHAAEHRSDGEQDQAQHEEALAPEEGGEPAGDGEHNGIGDQIGGEHPGGLIHPGGEGAGDMGQGHVDHRGVDDLHEGAGHHRNGDEPFVDFWRAGG